MSAMVRIFSWGERWNVRHHVTKINQLHDLNLTRYIIKYPHGWRQLMAWSNLANLFCGFLHHFCQLYYNIKQIDFIFLCFCTVIDHRWRHSVWKTKSHGTRLRLVRTFLFFTRHDVICDLLQYRRTQNEIYLLNKPNAGLIKPVTVVYIPRYQGNLCLSFFFDLFSF